MIKALSECIPLALLNFAAAVTSKVAPGVSELKAIEVALPLHNSKTLLVAVATGIGFTTTVFTSGVPIQPPPDGVMV